MSRHLTIPTADTQLYTVDNPGGAPPLLFLSGGLAPSTTGIVSLTASAGDTARFSSTPGPAENPVPRPTIPCREP